MKKMNALIIMDGFGINPQEDGNAVVAAGTPCLDALKARFPHTQISGSGMAVGLPKGQMGNSEVGHLNIGAGRVVYQELTRITKAIEDGDFYQNEALCAAMDHAKTHGTRLHLMGLVSDGGVHSHSEHLYALLKMAKLRGLEQAYIHAFLDGRDVPPSSGKGFIEDLEKEIAAIGMGKVATVMGRYWAMDRDNLWDRVQRAYDAMVLGRGLTAPSAVEAVAQSYEKAETDEFVQPTVIAQNGVPAATIGKDDAVVFFNFRPDRAREITRSLIFPDFDGFPREDGFVPVTFVSMTQYDATFAGRLSVAYMPQSLQNTLGEYLASLGKTQLRIAETQKYAHVTFFFNGGVEEPNSGEDRALIPSSKVATFDLKPEMSAYEVTEEAVKRIQSGQYDVMVLNFANPDMVGHTGIMEAAVKAVRVVDECVGKVVDAILAAGGNCMISADHGNAEQMVDYDTGEAYTAHTVDFPVPVILAAPEFEDAQLKEDGRLCDLAPTLLQMMHLPKPAEMTGESLIVG